MTRHKRIRQQAAAPAFAWILGLLIAMPVSGNGQESQPTLIRAGVVIDGTGRAPRENVAIVIRDGRIVAKRTLMAGFTTVRDPFGPYYADVALRDAIAAGWVDGPRMFVSGLSSAWSRMGVTF